MAGDCTSIPEEFYNATELPAFGFGVFSGCPGAGGGCEGYVDTIGFIPYEFLGMFQRRLRHYPTRIETVWTAANPTNAGQHVEAGCTVLAYHYDAAEDELSCIQRSPDTGVDIETLWTVAFDKPTFLDGRVIVGSPLSGPHGMPMLVSKRYGGRIAITYLMEVDEEDCEDVTDDECCACILEIRSAEDGALLARGISVFSADPSTYLYGAGCITSWFMPRGDGRLLVITDYGTPMSGHQLLNLIGERWEAEAEPDPPVSGQDRESYAILGGRLWTVAENEDFEGEDPPHSLYYTADGTLEGLTRVPWEPDDPDVGDFVSAHCGKIYVARSPDGDDPHYFTRYDPGSGQFAALPARLTHGFFASLSTAFLYVVRDTWPGGTTEECAVDCGDGAEDCCYLTVQLPAARVLYHDTWPGNPNITAMAWVWKNCGVGINGQCGENTWIMLRKIEGNPATTVPNHTDWQAYPCYCNTHVDEDPACQNPTVEETGGDVEFLYDTDVGSTYEMYFVDGDTGCASEVVTFTLFEGNIVYG